MLYYLRMNMVTIPKTKYKTLKKQAAAYRRILSAPREALHTLVHAPNKETLKAIRGLRAGKGEVFHGSTKDFFEYLLKGRAKTRRT